MARDSLPENHSLVDGGGWLVGSAEDGEPMTTNIPGRRVSTGETFFTDWVTRGGDCAFLRAQLLHKVGAGTVQISLETRSAEEVGGVPMDSAFPSSAPRLLQLSALGVKTAIYTATAGSNPTPRGFREQVRAKITTSGGSPGDYNVIRLFPLVFFDNSIPGS